MSLLPHARGTDSAPSTQILLLLCLCFLLQTAQSLQLHYANTTVPLSNVYNQQLYLQQLTMIQSQFATDITNIQATFVQLNLQLNQTNISSSA